MSIAALEISNLEIGYTQKKGKHIRVAGPMNIKMESGELHCLLGPNGVGKTTLLRTLAGIQSRLNGKVRILGEPLGDIHKRRLAKMLSVVLTDRISYGNLTAYELIALGRTPYTGWFGNLDNSDKEKIRWAIKSTETEYLIQKNIHELSDGERQKVMIARALAQDTPVILLDEPTAHLDLPNRVEIIRLLRKLARETEKAIVMSTHELDLALQAADRIWLMARDNELYSGVPEDLVLKDIFSQVFIKDGLAFDKQHGVFKVTETHFADINVEGDLTGEFWTKRALERLGYTVTRDKKNLDRVLVSNKNKAWEWQLTQGDRNYHFNSMSDLLEKLRMKGGMS